MLATGKPDEVETIPRELAEVQAVVLLAYELYPVSGVVSPTVGLAVKAHFASYFMTQKSDVEYVVLPGTGINPVGQLFVIVGPASGVIL